MPKIIENLDKEIIKQAETLISQKGVEDLTMRDLAKSCDVALGTIYNYFPTKENLLEAIILDYWEQQSTILNQMFTQEQTFYDKLGVIYHSVEVFHSQYREMMIHIHVSKPSKEEISRPKAVDQLLQMLERFIEKAKDGKEFSTPIASSDLSAFIFSCFSSMAKMKLMSFATFEAILRELLR